MPFELHLAVFFFYNKLTNSLLNTLAIQQCSFSQQISKHYLVYQPNEQAVP
jgi:hypothetical protein